VSTQRLSPPPDAAKIVGPEELTRLWKRGADERPAPPFKTGYRTGGGEIWAVDVSGRQLAHYDGDRWHVGGRLASGNLSAVWMTSGSDGWAVSRRPWSYGGQDSHLSGPAGDGLFRWDGRAWRFFRDLPERVKALWASGADDVWAVGEQGFVMHWDGARWNEQRLAGDFHAIFGRRRDDIWLNGCASNFYHWGGVAWSRVRNPVDPSHWGICPSLWGAAANDISAIGYDRFLRWDGVAWKEELGPLEGAAGIWHYEKWRASAEVPLARDAWISALWGTASGDELWAVGREQARAGFDGWPLVLRRRDGRWAKLPAPQTEGHLWGIWGDRADRVWAVGTKGLILRWDGASWTHEASGVAEALMSIHGAGDRAWIVGDRGTILTRSLAP
jgi:hypothetical protein